MKVHASALIVLLFAVCRVGAPAVPERFERASEPMETPHVAWARPLGGGPLKVLCLAPIPSQRDVVELAQRLEMEYDLVAFEHPLLHAEVAEEFQKLLKSKSYDLILLSKVPLAKLPEPAQALLVEKVRQGTGVLSVHSTATLQTGTVIHGSDSGRFLESGLPLDLLPDGCRPEIKVGKCGKGRSVRLSYAARVHCLTPMVDAEQVDYRDWETYYQLLCRASLWAAGRETGLAITSVWPSALSDRRIANPWQTEQVVRTFQPRLDRATGKWQIHSIEERSPLPTWCGYGAAIREKDGQLVIRETNVNADRGFAAGTFLVDRDQTPWLEIRVAKAKQWSLFVADPGFQRVLATLEPATGETGTRRYDLREIEGPGAGEPIRLCFSTIGEGTSLVLESLQLLAPDGRPVVEESPRPTVVSEDEIVLRLESPTGGAAAVTAIYRGPDHYQPVHQATQRVAFQADSPAEVRFPLLDRSRGHHGVDLVVRDEAGRCRAFATASYEVTSLLTLAAWAPEKEFSMRGDEAGMLARFRNDSGPRDVRVSVELTDMHHRLLAKTDQSHSIPAGEGEFRVALPTGNSLTTLNRARLRVEDATGLLLEADAWVFAPQAKPVWDDYFVFTSQFGGTSAYLRPYALQLARQFGIEGQVIPLRYSLEVLKEAAPVMYWGAADVRAFGYNFHGEQTSTARKPCLSDPPVRAKIGEAYERLGNGLKPLGPLALASLEDESELSGARYSNLEVCTSEHCTKRYHEWLRQQYGTIGDLNRQWDTSHGSFDEIRQTTYQEARKLANPAPWIDWRTFMEHVWLDGLLLTRSAVKKHFPDVRMGFSNSFGQMPFSGWNFETLSHHVDMTIEYPTIISQLSPPKSPDAFEEDAVSMSTVIRQKLDIRRSFMRDDAPSPGWIWYDRSEQGAELKPWWMAFLGAKGCTPWGPDSLGVREGARSMTFWAFMHPQLAHTRSSTWLASGLHDLTHGVGKIFVDYQRVDAPVAVLYSQPSMHLAWAWSDVERAFEPDTKSLYAWYYKSRVNLTRMLRELGFSYRYVGTSQIESGELNKYRVLFLPCSLCLSDETLQAIARFAEGGGTVVADLGTAAADQHGKPRPHRETVEQLFGISREAVCRTVEPGSLTISGDRKTMVPASLQLAGRDTIRTQAAAAAAHGDQTPAIVAHPAGKGKAVYLNGFLGYNMPSRQLIGNLLDSAGVASPVRVTGGGHERMGYEVTTFRRGRIEILGVLRLHDEQEPTQVELGERKHLYDVRAKRYLGLTDTAEFDLTKKAAAVLALMPYKVAGVKVQTAPAAVVPGQAVTLSAEVLCDGAAGDHVLRMEVYDPAGRLSRAYTDHVLAVGGRFEAQWRTGLNEPPGRWRVVVVDAISGRQGEAEYTVGTQGQ